MYSRKSTIPAGSLSSVALLIGLLASTPSFSTEPMISLEYVSRTDITDKSTELKEPSGLALSHESGLFWVVSDNSPAIYTFSADDPQNATRMLINENELEGIALAESAGEFFTVNEKRSRIKRFSMVDGTALADNYLGRMDGYAELRKTMEPIDVNSGIEGITWHSPRQSLFVIIEGPPGYLLEISPDLKSILSATELTAERGFVDPDKRKRKIDFSGVSHDASRDALWILSDKASRVYLYDLASGSVVQSLPLLRENAKGKLKKVDKAEGIALSADGTRLFVVSDSEGRFYEWKVRE